MPTEGTSGLKCSFENVKQSDSMTTFTIKPSAVHKTKLLKKLRIKNYTTQPNRAAKGKGFQMQGSVFQAPARVRENKINAAMFFVAFILFYCRRATIK